jgi:autotransporter-associated beta strand protein
LTVSGVIPPIALPPLVLAFALATIALSSGQVRINEFVANSSDRLLKRSPGSHPRVGTLTQWQAGNYDDSSWNSGNGPFGFGSFSGVSLGTNTALDMQNRVASLYLRKTFTATEAQASSAATLEFLARYNDGFIAYLNGVEIARRNLGNPGMFAYHDQLAFNVGAGSTTETIGIGTASNRLVAGQNTLCIQVHNSALSGASASTLLMEPTLRIAGGATLVSPTTAWRYFAGLAEPSGGVLDFGLARAFQLAQSPVRWATREFNDSSWPVGAGPVGVEGANPPHYILGTNLYAQTFNITPSIYQRNAFTASAAEASSTSPLRVTIDYDDGIIVYLNGKEIVRRNLGVVGVPTAYNTNANGTHNATGDNGNLADQSETINLAAASSLLVSGDNVLAIQLHRSSITSSDAIGLVRLETTGPGARVLTLPSDPVRYFIGTEEPVIAGGELDDTGALEDAPDSENDWIELFNAGTTAQSLDGWSLTDNAGSLRKWNFPAGTLIPPGGYLLVLASGLDTGPADGANYLHCNFKLSAAGEYLGLIDADGNKADEISPFYPPQDLFHSFGRDANGELGYFATPTPGSANQGPRLVESVAAPVFGTPGGFRPSSLSLPLSCPTPAAQIRYTLDGSEPTATSTLYSSNITISSNRIVRARAFKPDAIPSPVTTHTYLINQSAAKRSLPAILLGGNPALTFYGPNSIGGPAAGEGMFAIKGGAYGGDGVWNNANDSSAFHFPMLRGHASEKQATLEYLPLAGVPLRTELGLRISGSPYSRPRYTLTDSATARFNPYQPNQKPSFNLFFRSEFGDRPLDYPFFEGNPVTRFTDIRVRAGKNDISNPWITDELMRRIFVNMGQIGSTGTFNTLWINGVFKGYYNLTERLRQGFMQQHHASSEFWDVQQVNEFSDGDPLHWNKMISYLRNTNLATTAGYLGVHNFLDVDNFIDYMLLHSYAAVWDWPHNNWVAARERSASGRWRLYLWDAEGAFGVAAGRTVSHNSFTGDSPLVIGDAKTTTHNYLPAIYTLLSASPEFNLRFADRAQKHFFNNGALISSRITPVFNELKDRINPIMQETIGSTVNETFHNNWIVSGTRRSNYFTQLTSRNHWPSVAAPNFSHYGGTISAGQQLVMSNPNASGTLYYRSDGNDPRSPGGAINGTVYSAPLTLNASSIIRARVRSSTGVWSPEISASFVVPPPRPTFLPAASGDWNANSNWSTNPDPFPNLPELLVTIPAVSTADRNANLRAPITIGGIELPLGSSAYMNRVRDRDLGNTLTFANSNGALIEVSGNGTGYAEFENTAGTILSNNLELRVNHSAGHPEHGALRLRETWSGPGGLHKTGIGIASLTGGGKSYTGPTTIADGVLRVTQTATPGNSQSLTVTPGGQLRLTSGGPAEAPAIYQFGGPLSIYGNGRGDGVPIGEQQGILGALRYDPTNGGINHAVIPTPVLLAGPAKIHIDGSSNRLEISGSFGGPHPIAKSGGGTLVLSGDLSSQEQTVTVENGPLILRGESSAAFSLGTPTATLSGHGASGPVSGIGTLILDKTRWSAPQVAVGRQVLVFGQTGAPDFANPAESGNAVLVLNSPPPGGLKLDIMVEHPASPQSQAVFQGGWMTPHAENLAGALAATSVRVFIPDSLGSLTFNGESWSQTEDYTLTTHTANTPLGNGFSMVRMLELRMGGSLPATTYAAWRARHFPAPADFGDDAISGPAAAPFGNGVSNLVAYALGTAPDAPDISVKLPQLLPAPGGFQFQFPFDSRRDDIACIVEATDDLANWHNAAILFDSTKDFPPTADHEGRIAIPAPVTTEPLQFYRLRVVAQGF